MKYNILTGRWEFLPIELWMDTDHQAHLAAYRRHQAQELWKHTTMPEVQTGRPMTPTRPAFRLPTIQEDPHAYTVGFD